MPQAEVIELSIEETNKLRAELGLAPLRVENYTTAETGAATSASISEAIASTTTKQQQQQQQDAVLELSIDETNALREKLGLAPLRTGQGNGNRSDPIHAPPVNEQADAALKRIEQAKLARQVKEGMAKFTAQGSLGQDDTSALSWAKQMKIKQQQQQQQESMSLLNDNSKPKNLEEYDEKQLVGMKVAHTLSELQDTSTTILTLADEPLLKTTATEMSKRTVDLNDEEAQLENINLAEQRARTDGLREVRKLEMGRGHGGGYAGYDDDEFEELGGSQTSSRGLRHAQDKQEQQQKQRRGFTIGALYEDNEEEREADLFAFEKGKAISLQSGVATVVASDFMTAEEDKASRKKKQGKFKKKKNGHKDKTKRQRKEEESDDEKPVLPPKQGLLQALEQTAMPQIEPRKRKRSGSDDDEKVTPNVNIETANEADAVKKIATQEDKRRTYDKIMAKGNERTKAVFENEKSKRNTALEMDEEPDDAFLNAALAKARRLHRLRELQQQPKHQERAEAIVEEVKSSRTDLPTAAPQATNTISFAIDETREFTRALMARTEQTERIKSKKVKIETVENEAAAIKTEETEPNDEKMEDIAEMAKEIKEDDVDVTFGIERNRAQIGRGLGGVLNLLKQTGELTQRNAGKEEMRGRAKDKRTYEDYEATDLSKVVQIDERNATEKDKELAQREVKLEYRDKHGRLLTRKEAFRDLSYQFHGYGSGKRKEEKKMKQIAREQAEARLASRQASESGAGIFGALKTTQKATGKAFVVHKT